MMKFPSVSDEGTVPSGNSFALTYPGVFGSRVGGVGRGAGVTVGAAVGGDPGVLWAIAGIALVITQVTTPALIVRQKALRMLSP
jgi:hypothetical protein